MQRLSGLRKKKPDEVQSSAQPSAKKTAGQIKQET
jgi:hypothetical protein